MDKILRIPLHEIAPSRRGFLEAVGAVGIALVLPLPLAGCPDGEAEPRVTLHGPGEVEAGASGTWTLEVVAGPGGLPAGASVAVTVEHGTDWGAERTLAGGFAERLGGVSAEAEGDAVVEVVPLTVAAAYNGVVVEVVEGVVEPGQRLWIFAGQDQYVDV